MNALFAAPIAGLASASSLVGAIEARDFARLSLVALLILPLLLPLLDAWWHARRTARAGAPIPLREIIFMRLRRVNPAVIARAHIAAVAAGLDIPLAALQAHFLGRANVERTVEALCVAKAAGIALTFDRACAIEFSGQDATMAVAGAITPHAIPFGDALPAASLTIVATAGDGVMLSAGGTATVRCCLERLVGGAGEATLRARIGQAIVKAIAAAAAADTLTGDPAALERTVLAARLDAGTAFQLDAVAITLRRTGVHHAAPAPEVLQP